MRVLHDFVANGVVPLLGPPTSIGTFHHGAGYYYLLAPAAWLGGSDPTLVTAEIAIFGVAAVLLTALAARSVGGPAAGVLAGLLMAVSASSIDESTFIWNPNLVPALAALAIFGVCRAMVSGRGRWWMLAWAGAALAAQCHVLALLLLPPVAVANLAEVTRSDRRGDERRRSLLAFGVGLVIVLLTLVPLVLFELGHDFAETRAILAFVASGGGSGGFGPIVRLLIVAVRVLTWPFVGLITDAPLVATGEALALLGATVVLWRWRHDGHRSARWLVLTLAWGTVGLSVAAPSLTTVVPGLPVDHYHAFLDPVVVLIAALALGRLMSVRPGSGVSGDAPRPGLPALVGTVVVVALVGWNVAHWPPAVAADGGWPAAEATASELAAHLPAGETVSVVSLPSFKPPDTYVFPLERLGVEVVDGTGGDAVVVVCDQLFHEAIGADCGGAAEDARVAPLGLHLTSRTEAAPGRWVSLYRVRVG
jgi:4-amino-4-deoxy-L-arabinose transferase-like glycosyltransferase